MEIPKRHEITTDSQNLKKCILEYHREISEQIIATV